MSAVKATPFINVGTAACDKLLGKAALYQEHIKMRNRWYSDISHRISLLFLYTHTTEVTLNPTRMTHCVTDGTFTSVV